MKGDNGEYKCDRDERRRLIQQVDNGYDMVSMLIQDPITSCLKLTLQNQRSHHDCQKNNSMKLRKGKCTHAPQDNGVKNTWSNNDYAVNVFKLGVDEFDKRVENKNQSSHDKKCLVNEVLLVIWKVHLKCFFSSSSSHEMMCAIGMCIQHSVAIIKCWRWRHFNGL